MLIPTSWGATHVCPGNDDGVASVLEEIVVAHLG